MEGQWNILSPGRARGAARARGAHKQSDAIISNLEQSRAISSHLGGHAAQHEREALDVARAYRGAQPLEQCDGPRLRHDRVPGTSWEGHGRSWGGRGDALGGHGRPWKVTGGHGPRLCHGVVLWRLTLGGDQTQSEDIRSNQRRTLASAARRRSDAIRSNRKQSEVCSGFCRSAVFRSN